MSLSLRILHISDLHHRGAAEKEPWRRDVVLGDAWRSNLARLSADAPIDVVCFTGDVAFSGKRHEYEGATAFVLELLELLQLGRERLFIVPGNHDVDRERNVREYRELRASVDRGVDPLALSRWLAGSVEAPPRSVDSAWRDAVLERQAEFHRWLEQDLGLSHWQRARDQRGGLGYYASLALPGAPPIHVLGLDTAWLSGEHDKSNLLVTTDQFQRLARDAQGRELPGLRLVLMHHSFADLADARELRQAMTRHADLVLRGHLHATECTHVVVDPERQFSEFAVSSLFDSWGADQFRNGCQVVTIELDEQPLAGSTWFRSWSPVGHWHDDDSLNRLSRGGRLAWGMRKLPAAHSAASGEVATMADYRRSLRRYVSREGMSGALLRPDKVYVPQPGQRVLDASGRLHMHEVLRAFWAGAGNQRLLVLGNFGMGKTYLALRTVLEQIDAFCVPTPLRIPVYFPLKLLNCTQALSTNEQEARDVVDQLLDHARRFEFPSMTREAFVRLLREGSVRLVLDGLDELSLPHDIGWQRVLAPLLQLGPACCITSRTAYVGNKAELARDWDTYELTEWAEQEWGEYLGHCESSLGDVGGSAGLAATIDARPQLRALTTRPLWCFMIVEVRAQLGAYRDVGISALYQLFLNQSLDRVARTDRPGPKLMNVHRYMMLERLAEWCSVHEVPSMAERQLLLVVNAMFLELGLASLKDFLEQEVRVYSFVNCDARDEYSFGHASFRDYFFAASIARGLCQAASAEESGDVPTVPACLEGRDLAADEIMFLAGILDSELTVSSLQLADVTFRHADSRVRVHCEQLLADAGVDPQARRNLLLIYLSIARSAGEARLRLPALQLADVALPGEDLSNCDLAHADFTGGNLTRVSFRDSTLTGAQFFRAIIDEADFGGADLAEADLRSIEAPATPPSLHGARNLDRATLDDRTRRSLNLASSTGAT